MILLIDNYDSFAHNLARYVRNAGAETTILRNDDLSAADALALKPDAIVISPGPGAPKESGICIDLIKKAKGRIPVLGICLGHQAIAEAYGGKALQSDTPYHGKSTPILHDGSGLFDGIPSPFEGGRYHSLSVQLPPRHDFLINAYTEDGTIMSIQHIREPVYGLQFHPESILTEHGALLIDNFMRIVHKRKKAA